jgi:hypothetical protein
MSVGATEPVFDLIGNDDGFDRAGGSRLAVAHAYRLAALVAVEAPPASYVTNLAVAEKVGLTVE